MSEEVNVFSREHFCKVSLTLLGMIYAILVGLFHAIWKRIHRLGKSAHPHYTLGKEIQTSAARRVGNYMQKKQEKDSFYVHLQRQLFEKVLEGANKQCEKDGYVNFDYEADGVPCRAVCKKDLESEVKAVLGITKESNTVNKVSDSQSKCKSDIRWILQHHGGGYTSGTINSGQPAGHHMCKHVDEREEPYKVVVIIVDYALAPEKQFPGAVVDAVKCFKFHSAIVGASNIVMAGESAGGGLVLCTLQALRDGSICTEKGIVKDLKEVCATEMSPKTQRNDLPAAAVVMSPMLSCMQETQYNKNVHLDQITAAAVRRSAITYVPDSEMAKHPLASPINGSFHDLPPILITAGGTEIFLPLIEKFSVLAKEHSDHQKVYLKVYEGCVHSFQLDWCKHAKKLYDHAMDFVYVHTSYIESAENQDKADDDMIKSTDVALAAT